MIFSTKQAKISLSIYCGFTVYVNTEVLTQHTVCTKPMISLISLILSA